MVFIRRLFLLPKAVLPDGHSGTAAGEGQPSRQPWSLYLFTRASRACSRLFPEEKKGSHTKISHRAPAGRRGCCCHQSPFAGKKRAGSAERTPRRHGAPGSRGRLPLLSRSSGKRGRAKNQGPEGPGLAAPVRSTYTRTHTYTHT